MLGAGRCARRPSPRMVAEYLLHAGSRASEVVSVALFAGGDGKQVVQDSGDAEVVQAQLVGERQLHTRVLVEDRRALADKDMPRASCRLRTP